MAEESIKYTSFVVPSGQYEYKKMLFGIKTGPGFFNRFMNWVLADFMGEENLVVFMDDINIFSKGLSEHLDLLRRAMRRLSEYQTNIWRRLEICHRQKIQTMYIRPHFPSFYEELFSLFSTHS